MVVKLYWVHIEYSERLKRAFLIFAKFKSWRSVEIQIAFKQRETKLSRQLLIGSILKNGLEANFRSYSISRAFQNRIFHVFANFSATMWGKWGKWGKKSKLFKFDGFEATLTSKANVVNLRKCHFSVFLALENSSVRWFVSYIVYKVRKNGNKSCLKYS